MVVGIVASLAGFVKARVSKTQVDNAVFRLHYRWTTSFCYLCCALIAASDFIGKPIECIGASKAATTYCWVTSTYTINTTSKKSDASYYGAYGSKYFGLGTYDSARHEKTYHAYYQWVPFVLFFQGCLFYLPHQIWKAIEGKQLENLLQGLNVFSVFNEDIQMKRKNIVKYLDNSWGLSRKYSFGYILCEVLNLVNVFGQMFLLDGFFGGMFWNYGSKIIFLPLEDDAARFDPMIERFPRVTKCDFFQYGSSGTIENRDYLCILPQNLLNEKIFFVMWIWFIILATITILQLLFRLAILQFPIIRLKLLEQRGKVESKCVLESLVRYMHLSDFFLLYNIGKNINALVFKDIINELHESRNGPLPTPKPSAPMAPVRNKLYNPSFVPDTLSGDDTIDLKLRKKIMEEDNV